MAMVTIANAQVVFNATNFPDPNFRAALMEQVSIYGYDEYGVYRLIRELHEGDILYNNGYYDNKGNFRDGRNYSIFGGHYNQLELNNKNVSDLTGIEHLIELSILYCSGNRLTSLDVSKNTALTVLSCSYNQLTALDVSKNTALTSLSCSGNQLTSLDVSKNTALWDLYCSGNQLSSLDVSKNTTLWDLNCSGNQLSSLDVSKNTALGALYCSGNQLSSLDVSKNTALWDLDCSGNQLSSLDVSGCTALEDLDCCENQLTSLNVSGCNALTKLYCYVNQLTSLDVSGCTALTELSCHSNRLASLDASGCTALEDLVYYDNHLTSLDVSGCTALGVLYCSGNQLTSLNVSGCTALRGLECYGNQIKGEAMDALVGSLPTVENGEFHVINTKDTNEGNICTKAQVAVAKEKGWTVYDYNYDGSNWVGYVEYEGSDEAILLDEENFPDDNFRNALSKFFDIPENYEITGDLISVTTKLDISNNQITNTIGIEHLTSLEELWCHCNIIAGEAMAKLIASLTNLNISEAKGLMLTEETNPRKGALYALDFTDENEQNVCTAEHVEAANAKGWTVYCKTSGGWQEYNGEIPTGINTVDSGELTDDSWYTIDGKKLAGEPTRKGVYIVNGKKVMK